MITVYESGRRIYIRSGDMLSSVSFGTCGDAIRRMLRRLAQEGRIRYEPITR